VRTIPSNPTPTRVILSDLNGIGHIDIHVVSVRRYHPRALPPPGRTVAPPAITSLLLLASSGKSSRGVRRLNQDAMPAAAPPAGREVPLAFLQDQTSTTEPVTGPAADPRSKTGQEVRAPLSYLFLVQSNPCVRRRSARLCSATVLPSLICSPISAAAG
jgi:hypothetical protein